MHQVPTGVIVACIHGVILIGVWYKISTEHELVLQCKISIGFYICFVENCQCNHSVTSSIGYQTVTSIFLSSHKMSTMYDI